MTTMMKRRSRGSFARFVQLEVQGKVDDIQQYA